VGVILSWEHDYLALVSQVIDDGYRADSRAGPTRSLPGCTLKIPLDDGFPLLTTRKMYPGGVFGELAGFVRGAEDLATYEKFGCNYWYDNAAEWSENKGKPESEWRIGRSYGSIWRQLNGIDQLATTIENLRTDPLSRRHVISAYEPNARCCLPSCHILFQFYVREGGLHCGVFMRSVDLCVGLPSDIVLYALLTELVARDTALRPMSLTFFLMDCHCYENHVQTFIQQKGRQVLKSPSIALSRKTSTLGFLPTDVIVQDYLAHDPIKYQFNK